jgi:DNA-binding CsgD family transcriptional regulator
MIRRFSEVEAEARHTLLTRCRVLFGERRWDEALCVAEVSKDPTFATEALVSALDDLLAAGRTSSLQRWVTTTRSAGAEGSLIDYAEGEALLRGNELEAAAAFATQAARSLDGDLAARAHLVAGMSAHLTDRWRIAEDHAEAAAGLAQIQKTREGALWLRFIAGFAPERPDLEDRLDQFKRSARPGIRQSLNIASGELSLAEFDGNFERALDRARSALSMVKEGIDPFALTGLLNIYSYSLILTCRYDDSLKQVEVLLRVAESSGLEFPVPYAQVHRAKALVGSGRFTQAARTLSLLERYLKGSDPSSYFRGSLPVQRARLYASTGDLKRALDVMSLGPYEGLSRTGQGEFLGWQALLHAAAGDMDRARTLAVDARSASRSLEVVALGLLAEGIAALAAKDTAEATAHLGVVIENGVWDPAVIAVRSSPALGEFVADQPEWRGWLQGVLSASSDHSTANRLGLQVPRAARRPVNLTPRESEVHELLAQGLTNEKIAKQLYISLSTTKVHVKHIYEKLGVQSRLEAARALRDDV